jgi:hypothetical protein
MYFGVFNSSLQVFLVHQTTKKPELSLFNHHKGTTPPWQPGGTCLHTGHHKQRSGSVWPNWFNALWSFWNQERCATQQ